MSSEIESKYQKIEKQFPYIPPYLSKFNTSDPNLLLLPCVYLLLKENQLFWFSSRLNYTNYKFRTTEQSTIRKYCQLSKGAKNVNLRVSSHFGKR